MLSDKDLRELLEFITPDPVISIYMSTDPSEGNADAHRLRLRSMMREINLTKDVETIERYFEREYNWGGRGVAIFSCSAQDFFRVYPLAVPVRNVIHISDRPNVKPLAGLIDNYGGYGVVLVDKQGARFFSFHMGQLVEQEGMMGESIKRVKHGQGGSTVPGGRGHRASTSNSVDEQIDRNMKEAVESATAFFEDKHVRRILIGGTDKNASLFQSLLPKAWQSLVKGTFAMPITATHNEVLERALEIGMEAERHHEAQLVERVITLAAKKSGGVVGLEDVIGAVNEGRVQVLVTTEGFRKNAYRCKSTGMLTLKPEITCPGEDDVEKVYDVVNELVSTVMRQGGEVEVLLSNPEMEKAGNIGAVLRY